MTRPSQALYSVGHHQPLSPGVTWALAGSPLGWRSFQDKLKRAAFLGPPGPQKMACILVLSLLSVEAQLFSLSPSLSLATGCPHAATHLQASPDLQAPARYRPLPSSTSGSREGSLPERLQLVVSPQLRFL